MGWFSKPPEPWTREEDERLCKLVKLGYSFSRIAAEIGRERNAISGRIFRLGLKSPASTKSRDPGIRNKPRQSNPRPQPVRSPEATFFLNGEALVLAVTDEACARCAVRESFHHEHGCGQFAVRVVIR